MTLDKIVDAYLAVTALTDDPGCPAYCERVAPATYCNPPGMLLKHLDATIHKSAVTDDGTLRSLTHRGRPLVYCLSHRRWRLEDSRVVEDSTHIEVKERG